MNKGYFTGYFHEAGRPKTNKTPALEEAVPHEIDLDPETSNKIIVTNHHCSHKLLWVISYYHHKVSFYQKHLLVLGYVEKF